MALETGGAQTQGRQCRMAAARRSGHSRPQAVGAQAVSAQAATREEPVSMTSLGLQTLYFEDLGLGMRESLRKTVESEDVVGFAELTGDHNPIHLSDHFARKTRFGERIVHGLYTASLISAVIGMRLPGPGSVYVSQTLNFRGPVKIGDVIEVNVEVVELVETGRRVRLKCECLVDGKVVLDGEGVLIVPRAQAPAS